MNNPLYHVIWLCDDDADDHFVFKEALGQVLPQASITCFTNGYDLLVALQDQRPDMLFLDINMPSVNGLEALLKIREMPLAVNLPIVIYSVSDSSSDVMEAYDSGAELYLVKPQVFQDAVSQLKCIFKTGSAKHECLSTLKAKGLLFSK